MQQQNVEIVQLLLNHNAHSSIRPSCEYTKHFVKEGVVSISLCTHLSHRTLPSYRHFSFLLAASRSRYFGNLILPFGNTAGSCKVTHFLLWGSKVSVIPAGNTVKVKVKFTLDQAMKAQRGSRGIDLLFL